MPTTRPKSPTNYGSLLLRGAVWHARFTVNGITVAKSTKTGNRREAERIVAKWKSELVQQVVLEGKKPIKLHDALDLFVKSRAHLPSAQGCEIHLRVFKQLPNHNLDRITGTEIQNLLNDLRTKYAESTIKVTWSYFNAMLKYCEEHGYTGRKKVKRINHDGGKIRWLTKDELSRLYVELDPVDVKDAVLKAQKQENYDLSKLLYETGGRLTEISRMRWTQVDLVVGTVYMRRLKGSVSNTIRMTSAMREVFERRRKMDNSDFVFDSKQQSKVSANNRWFNNAVKRAMLDETQGTVTLHTLRHSKCVHLLQGGLGIVELQQWIGHRSIQSTLCYSHVVESSVTQRAFDISEGIVTAK